MSRSVFCEAERSSYAGDNGRTPGPGWRKCTAYRQTGPGGLPLALRLSEGLGVSFCCNSALLACLGLDRLSKYGIYPSLPARAIGTERCQDVWIDPKCDRLFRRKFVLASKSAKLCDSCVRTAAMGDYSLLPVNSCWGHGRPCGRKRRSNLVFAKEARSSL